MEERQSIQSNNLDREMSSVTGFPQTAAALWESQERLQVAIDSARMGTYDWNLTDRTVIWNRYHRTLLGYAPEVTAAYEAWEQRVHPADLPRVTAAIHLARDTQTDYACEYRVIWEDGSVRWLEAFGRFYYDNDRAVRMSGVIKDITDRVQAQTAIEESEANFRTTFDRVAVGLAHVGWHGEFLSVNQKFCEILGYSAHELMELDFHVTHPDDIATDLVYIRRLLAKEIDSCSYEKRYIHKLGRTIWANVTVALRTSSGGEPLYFIASIEQIDDRKQMLARLQTSEERLQLTIDGAQFGTFDWDLSTQEIIWNDRHRLLLGYPIDLPASYEAWERRVASQDLQRVRMAIELARDEHTQYACEYRIVWDDGSVRWLEAFGQFYYDNLDRPVRMTGIVNDITDRKQTELALQESEYKLNTGIRVAGMALARFDYTTNLVTLSPEAAAMYGFAPDELEVTRERIHSTFHPDELSQLMAIIDRVIDPAGEGWFERDHRVVWPSGEVRYLSVRKQVFFDRSGAVHRPSYAILAAIDVTDRKRAELTLAARNQELDSFVHTVAHDLKAPLRAMANLANWIEEDWEGTLPTHIQQHISKLQRQVKRMSNTVDGLLDYARAGRNDSTIELVNVSELLSEIVDSLSVPPTFTISLAPNIPSLYAKRLLLFQVFANLIGNGIKHHDRLDGQIVVAVAARDNCYEFAVTDDGPGIAPEYQDRIFTIFKTGNPQNRKDSTGIGLAIVKKIVEAEGGTVRLESEVGNGTTFYFTWSK